MQCDVSATLLIPSLSAICLEEFIQTVFSLGAPWDVLVVSLQGHRVGSKHHSVSVKVLKHFFFTQCKSQNSKLIMHFSIHKLK